MFSFNVLEDSLDWELRDTESAKAWVNNWEYHHYRRTNIFGEGKEVPYFQMLWLGSWDNRYKGVRAGLSVFLSLSRPFIGSFLFYFLLFFFNSPIQLRLPSSRCRAQCATNASRCIFRSWHRGFNGIRDL